MTSCCEVCLKKYQFSKERRFGGGKLQTKDRRMVEVLMQTQTKFEIFLFGEISQIGRSKTMALVVRNLNLFESAALMIICATKKFLHFWLINKYDTTSLSNLSPQFSSLLHVVCVSSAPIRKVSLKFYVKTIKF